MLSEFFHAIRSGCHFVCSLNIRASAEEKNQFESRHALNQMFSIWVTKINLRKRRIRWLIDYFQIRIFRNCFGYFRNQNKWSRSLVFVKNFLISAGFQEFGFTWVQDHFRWSTLSNVESLWCFAQNCQALWHQTWSDRSLFDHRKSFRLDWALKCPKNLLSRLNFWWNLLVWCLLPTIQRQKSSKILMKCFNQRNLSRGFVLPQKSTPRAFWTTPPLKLQLHPKSMNPRGESSEKSILEWSRNHVAPLIN